jgi:PAS domain-containing protein
MQNRTIRPTAAASADARNAGVQTSRQSPNWRRFDDGGTRVGPTGSLERNVKLLKDSLDRLVPAVQRAIQEAETLRTRKRAEAALGQSEARKADILDSVLDSIVTMDADGMVIEFNAAAARTFGYNKGEAI